MLTTVEIIDLWNEGGALREVAAAEIVRNFADNATLFFDFIDKSVELCSIAKREMPFLRKGFATNIKSNDEKSYEWFDWIFNSYKVFFNELDEYLSNNKQNKVQLLQTISSEFLGIKEEIYLRYGVSSPNVEEDNNRQLMIFVTGRCNLHCKYCFSDNIEQTSVGIKELTEMIEWAKINLVKTITPCGGEPLLYAHFQSFLNLIVEYGMTTYFASNFTIDISKFVNFNRNIIRVIYVHLTDEIFINEQLKSIVVRNIEISKARGIELVARANISVDCN